MRRVAVTGLGAVSALGVGVQAALVRGQELLGPGALAVGREVEDVERVGGVAQVAPQTRRAQKMSYQLLQFYGGVAPGGSGMGGVVTQDDRYHKLYAEGTTRLHPFSIPRIMNNAAAAQVSMRWGLGGPTLSLATACAAAAHAIGEAAEIIRADRADVMIAGGAEAPIAPGVLRCWEAMRVLAPASGGDPSRVCRPFSRDRLGMVLGEGAGIVVLESWDRATARGAPILAELAGYAATSDAAHITQPGVEAPARALAIALDQARLAPPDVDYVNAHGTATRLNDSTETAIIKRAFSPAARRLAISSTKAAHGHAMGASAALELIATVLAIRNGVVPPTLNYTQLDPECDLDYVPNNAREMPVRAAVSNSFAFGGLNAVLVVRAA